jgi:hypothetical protein
MSAPEFPLRPITLAGVPAVRCRSVRPTGAESRAVTETDLLVAALKDHIQDLHIERDELRAELSAVRTALSHAEATSLYGRMKPVRDSLS